MPTGLHPDPTKFLKSNSIQNQFNATNTPPTKCPRERHAEKLPDDMQKIQPFSVPL